MRIIGNIVEKISIVILITLVLVIALQIGGRIFNSPFMWTEELSRHLLVYATFLGAALAYYHGEGLKITAILERFNKVTQKIINITMEILCLITSIIVLYYSFTLTLTMWDSPTPALRIDKGLVYLALPLGFSLIIIKILMNIVKLLKDKPLDSSGVNS
ncbi:TRAP transporter small permease [Ureibacillus acetophenoni]